jgi:hypothetical protein
MVFTEEKVYIRRPAKHRCSRVGGNNVMEPFRKAIQGRRSWKLKVEKNNDADER